MGQESNLSLIYVTAENRQQAAEIARNLVESKLAACANILGEITSVYRWEGEIQNETETAMIIKTSADNVSTTIERIEELHPYETPCAIEIKIGQGSEKFLNWIDRETL